MALWNLWRIWRILGCLFCLGVCACLIWLAVISQSGSWYYTPLETPVTTHCSWCWTQRCFHHWFSQVLFRLANCVSAGGCCHVLRLFQEDLEMDVLSPWLRTRPHPSEIWQWTVFWGVTTCSQYRVFTLYYYHLVINWSTHLIGGINIHLFPPTNPLRFGPLLPYKQSKRRVGSRGMHGEHDLYGFVHWEIFPDQAGKKNTPLILDSVFPKKKYFPGTCFFFLGSQWIFFRDRPPH